MPQDYKYQRLEGESTIRVLKLHAAARRAAKISCSLMLASVDPSDTSYISYEAISYVWGSKTPDVPIACDGATVYITKNGEEALRRVRRQTRSRVLWLDSVCIDQSSIEERNQQVRHMGQIYGQATRVLIWLEHSSGLPISTRLLIRSLKLLLTLFPNLTISRESNFRSRSLKLLEPLEQSLQLSDWARRAWTFQEFALASDWTIWNGTFWISADTLTRGISPLLNHFVRMYLNSGAWYNRLVYNVRSTNSTQALHDMCHQKASDPRDLVFAMYELLETEFHNLEAPDYGKTTEQVFTETVCAIIGSLRSLEFNFYLQPPAHKKPGLPSWIPDFADEVAFGPLGSYLQSLCVGSGYCAAPAIYNKADALSAGFEAGAPWDLHLSGASIGVVDFVGKPVPTRYPDADAGTESQGTRTAGFDAWAIETFRTMERANGLNVIDAFFALVFVDATEWDPYNPERQPLVKLDELAVARWTGITGSFISWLYEQESDLASLVPDSRLLRNFRRGQGAPDKLDWRHELFGAHGWSFFKLSTGHFGLGCGPVRVGDVAAIVAGFSMPIILRPSDDGKWEFNGLAKIPGAMFGEKWPEDSSLHETFVVV